MESGKIINYQNKNLDEIQFDLNNEFVEEGENENNEELVGMLIKIPFHYTLKINGKNKKFFRYICSF